MSIKITKEEILESIRENRFCLYYQGIFNLNDSKMYGVEALLRWNHPQFNDISPEIYIPIIEQYGLMDELGRMITVKSLQDLKALNEKLNVRLNMSINLSPYQLSIAFINFVKQLIDENAITPNTIQFEITETSLLDSHSIELLEKLRGLGVKLAIDDFGKGYSFYDQLMSVKFHTLKIDKVFLQNIEQKQEYRIALESILDLAKRLNIEVVVEGVETFNQLQYLKSINCKWAQGFYFSKPIPSLAFMELEQIV